jgi:H+/Cl- antiporter ClcA
MKKTVPVIMTVAGIILGLWGILFLREAGAIRDAREVNMISGIVCVALGTGLLIASGVFAMRSKD